MAQFTVRVELHQATRDDYTTLHRAMEQRGFSRKIRSDDGRIWHLPWAEYDATATRGQTVLAAATAAAATTGKSSSILVTESAGRTWNGLVPA